MDSYIVRVYRRNKLGNSPARGLVEKVGVKGHDVFGTKEELWNILSVAKKTRRKHLARWENNRVRYRKVQLEVKQ